MQYDHPVSLSWGGRAIVALALFAALGAGCDRGAEPATPSPSDEGPGERVVREDATLSANLPERPARIVSLAPSTTEVLYALGAGERVVGVTRYCDFPEEVSEVPKIGGMLDPDLEAILAARPDLVVGVQAGADHQVADQLQEAGVAYAFARGDDLKSALHTIELLGAWIGEDEAGRELRAQTERGIDEVSERLRTTQGAAPQRALLAYDREPVVVAGPGSFGDELLGLAGLENAAGDATTAYPVLDMEAVIEAGPQLIVDVSLNVSSEEVLGFWKNFDSLPAVREGRVVHLPDAVMMRPGPRVPQALELLGEAARGADSGQEAR
ncbi:ABC transporter substrate-binding protein [Lujinxingia vulgaris]|uniref:ABC transporter substrate-binding protein n=1 Tax=Lujinxingia vulgaris TaxID=2600176 RepID=UPI001E3408F9|nr:helical backbone metal receptor [Lujinxingia vulgaris]